MRAIEQEESGEFSAHEEARILARLGRDADGDEDEGEGGEGEEV